MNYRILLIILNISQVLSAQDISPSAIIEYYNNGMFEVASQKREFIYDNKGRTLEESIYSNEDGKIRPDWKIHFKRITEYDASGEVSNNIYFNYHLDNEGERPVIASRSENHNKWSEDRSQLISSSIVEYYDITGQLTGAFGYRSINTYDENGCFTGTTSFSNNDIGQKEENWVEDRTVDRIVDSGCRLLSESTYERGVLIGTIEAEYNEFNGLIYEERHFNLQDTSQLEVSTLTREYDDFNRPILERYEFRKSGNEEFYYINENTNIYSNLEQPDSVLWYFESSFEIRSGLTVKEYDDEGRTIYVISYNYQGNDLDSLTFSSESWTTYNEQGQILTVTSIWCENDRMCTENSETRRYNDRQEFISRRSIRKELLDGYSIEETVSEYIVTFRCDRSRDEEINSRDGEVIRRTEYIYPIQPLCASVIIGDNTVIAPNPASDRITLWTTFLNGLETSIRIVDMTGRVMKEETIKTRYQFSYDVGDIPPGFYFVELSRETGSIAKQMMIVR